MANLKTKIELYLKANSKTWDAEQDNILLQSDNGEAPYIKTWNVSGLAKPTDDQLATYNSAATTEENNNAVTFIRLGDT